MDRPKRRRGKLENDLLPDGFQYNRKLKDKAQDFQRKHHPCGSPNKASITFSWHDVVNKFGWNTNCYLTGRPINLQEPDTYHFDHKVPLSKGGSSDIENLGIAYNYANLAKNDLMIEDFILLCKEVLEFNGYQVQQAV